MARAPPEEGRGLALLPLQHGDPRLLGGPRRLRCAPREDEDAANPRIDRAGRGILSGPTAVPRGARSLPTLVPATLSRTLLLRHSGRTRHPHISRVWRGPADATRPRPPRSDAQPGRKLEHGCPSPGQRRPGVPVSRAVLPPRPRGPGPAKPMDHDDRALGPETGGPLTRRGPPSHRRNRGWTAAGRARTGDFEIFSLALSQTELPRREASERPAGEIVYGRVRRVRLRWASLSRVVQRSRPCECSRAPRGLRFGPADSLRERGNPHRSRPSALLISGPAGRG